MQTAARNPNQPYYSQTTRACALANARSLAAAWQHAWDNGTSPNWRQKRANGQPRPPYFEALRWEARNAIEYRETQAAMAQFNIDLERARTGTAYERACYDEFILNQKDHWSAADYAAHDAIVNRKRAAANDLQVAA